MSLKTVAEKLAKELEGVGKKLDQTVVRLAESVDGIVASIPKAQFAEKGFDGLPPSARKAMLDGIIKITDAAPSGAAKSKIAIEYLNTLRIKFPEGKAGDTAFQKFGQDFAKGLDAEVKAIKPDLIRQAGGPVAAPRAPTPVSADKPPVVNIDGRTTKPARNMGDAERVEPRFDEPAAGGNGGGKPPGPDEHAPDAGKAPKKPKTPEQIEAAEAVISNSLMDMHTVRTTNGKMPKQAFFGELQNSLREVDLLVVRRSVEGVGDEIATTPQKVYDRIAKRLPVEETEMRTLAEYFGRFHNDARAAREIASQAPMQTINTGRGMVGVAESIIRRIPTSEGGRTTATIAQNHAWETGSSSFIRNRISAFQESPLTTTVSYSALAFAAFLTQQTYSTIQNFQEPNYIGREIMAVVTPDTRKEIDDYVEYAHARFNSNVPEAMSALKKYYGIEKIDNSNGAEVVESLLKGPKPPFNPSADITQALVMFVSQKVYGKAVASTADLKGLQNEQVTKIAEASTVDANKDAETRAATAQAGLNNPAAVQNRMTFGKPTVPTEPVYDEYQVDGESFNNRAKGLTYNNQELYDDLAKAFKGATKMPVNPEDELTASNKLTKNEAVLFAAQAREILAKRNVDAEKAEQMVQLLIEPTTSSPALSR